MFLVGIGTLDTGKVLGIFAKQGGYTPEQNMTFHDSSPGFALHGEFRRPMRNSLAHQDMSFSTAGNLKPLTPEFLKIACL